MIPYSSRVIQRRVEETPPLPSLRRQLNSAPTKDNNPAYPVQQKQLITPGKDAFLALNGVQKQQIKPMPKIGPSVVAMNAPKSEIKSIPPSMPEPNLVQRQGDIPVQNRPESEPVKQEVHKKTEDFVSPFRPETLFHSNYDSREFHL